uniref:Uncharacterized protein n=1 Tax=Anguilla anguilla TaxID=7936 RepID=A0A0E9QBW4_ANGAN
MQETVIYFSITLWKLRLLKIIMLFIVLLLLFSV